MTTTSSTDDGSANAHAFRGAAAPLLISLARRYPTEASIATAIAPIAASEEDKAFTLELWCSMRETLARIDAL